ncbi:MAG: hypothetical protein ACOYMV_07625 [Verrucomicrobiia bacterium]
MIVLNTRVADDCFMELRAHGVRMGRDLELLAIVMSGHHTRLPGYRVLDVGQERCGQLAVQRLMDLVEKKQVEPCRIALPVLGWAGIPVAAAVEAAG